MIIIREINKNDAGNFISLCQRLDHESQFMLLEPGERTTTLEEQQNIIKDVTSSKNKAIFVAEINNNLVGFLAVMGGMFRKNRHTASVVVGILQKFTRKGIGSKLFQELENWAFENKLCRLELSVMTHNEAALEFYKKIGFQIEGDKRNALIENNQFVDEHYMAKILPLDIQ
ncbi:MAG: GNAT family N-acetyltransferase [Gallionellaceae bacterium]